MNTLTAKVQTLCFWIRGFASSRCHFFVASGALLVFSVAAFAQDRVLPDPPELQAKQGEYIRSLQRVEAPVMSGYVRTLESLKMQFTREGKLEAALAVDAELKIVNTQLTGAANVGQGNAAARLTIMSVKYGGPKTNRMIDPTKVVKGTYASGDATMKLEGVVLSPGKDPADGVRKSMKVVYTFFGQVKEKMFKDGDVVNFQSDLQ